MIIYSSTKRDFNNDVINNLISDKILMKMHEANIHGGGPSEYHSWQNSLNFMNNVLVDPEIPDDVNVAIEYQIPKTSKRVDFIIAGADKDDKSNVVIIELKQWEKAQKIDDEMLHSVKAFTGGAERIVNHPSYQAYAYATFIRNSSEQVQDEDINIASCAYLHNYDNKYIDELNDDIYKIWYEEAPFFIKTQVNEIRILLKNIFQKNLKMVIYFIKLIMEELNHQNHCKIV